VTAVASYAEASGAGGGPAALAQGLSPLDGIVVPALCAYDLIATFFLPFVAIRLVAAERESGAGALLAQTTAGLPLRLAVKGLVLAVGGLAACLPGALALVLWRSYGGPLAFPETAAVWGGHALHALLLAAIAFAAAAVCRGSASAAIATLAVTVGTWALDFVAQGRGGLLARLAPFTPAAALHAFERGDVRLAAVTVLCAASAAAVAFAAVWLDPFRIVPRKLVATGALLAALALAVAAASALRTSWDLAEDRRSSLPRADEAALSQLAQPVRITVHLSPEDPKLYDLESNVLAKLRRVIPDLTVTYAAAGRTGLFANDGAYGEVWYQVGAKKTQLRSTTEPIVLGEIYRLAGVAPPPAAAVAPYPGYPLAVTPRGAAPLFYLAWPLAVGLAFAASRGRRRTSWSTPVTDP